MYKQKGIPHPQISVPLKSRSFVRTSKDDPVSDWNVHATLRWLDMQSLTDILKGIALLPMETGHF